MSRERSVQTGWIFGRKIDDARPEDELGFVVEGTAATPERIERAGRYFTEIQPDELSPLSARLWQHRDGTQFRIVESQVLESRDPARTSVTHFFVAADRLVFLKQRGVENFTAVVNHGFVHAQKIDATPKHPSERSIY